MDALMVKDGSGLVSPCLSVCTFFFFPPLCVFIFSFHGGPKSRWTSQDLYGWIGLASMACRPKSVSQGHHITARGLD
jgi:hypothetical protein